MEKEYKKRIENFEKELEKRDSEIFVKKNKIME